MSDKAKNIITNILGIIFCLISVYYAVTDKNAYVEVSDYLPYLLKVISTLVLGNILFIYKINETKAWANKFLNKKLNQD